mgnify:CR=1 FL=1
MSQREGILVVDDDAVADPVGRSRETYEATADLPAVLAVASSLRGRPLPADLVAFGRDPLDRHRAHGRGGLLSSSRRKSHEGSRAG